MPTSTRPPANKVIPRNYLVNEFKEFIDLLSIISFSIYQFSIYLYNLPLLLVIILIFIFLY